MKYISEQVAVTFQEVPDEISLCIPISGCPYKCEGCHSPELREDIGRDLTWDNVNALIHIHKGITCVCFLGGDADPKVVDKIASNIKRSTDLKVCWYSGKNVISSSISIPNFDYIKIGHYDKEKGPLSSPTTNQRLIQPIPFEGEFGKGYDMKDITYKFWKNENQSKKTQQTSANALSN